MLETWIRLFRKTSWAGTVFGALIAAQFVFPASAAIIGGDLNAIIGGDASFIADTKFAVVGQIERIDRRNKLVVVLGQTYAIASMSRITIDGLAIASQGAKGIKLVRVGDYVALAGSEVSSGTAVASRIAILAPDYVDGSSSTYVRGQVTWLDPAVGLLTVGSLQVDYTFALASFDATQLSVGDSVELLGIRPTSSGPMLAFSAETSDANGIVGGNANVIVGGDVNGIIGGDASAIVGGDAG